VFDLKIPFTQYLAVDGTAIKQLPEFARDLTILKSMYRAMLLTRLFDEKAIALQRTGRLGTFASSLGQEAVSIGAASAMRLEDVLVPSFREQGAQLWRGVTMTEILQFWGGDERGSDFTGPREDFPVSIPVASHAPHAAGVALAFQLRKELRVAVCILGDGATSKGDFYEAINVAAAWKVPAVFIINNNQWAISVPRASQTAAATLAQKSIAAGMPGEQVDGNDVVAVHHVVSRAIEAARHGQGPALIEAITYRLADHTTADDAHRYRNDKEVSSHWKAEPIARLRAFLVSQEAWSKQDEEALLSECSAQVAASAAAYLAVRPQAASDMFNYLFADMPEDLRAQMERFLTDSQERTDG